MNKKVFELHSDKEKLFVASIIDVHTHLQFEKYFIAGYYQRVGDKLLWDFAFENRVASIVAHTLKNILHNNNNKIPNHWEIIHSQIHDLITDYLLELDRIAAVLAKQDIVLIALKNGGISRAIFHCPGCCPMGDLDVLVEKQHFHEAHQVLVSEGFQFEFRSDLEVANLDIAINSGGTEYWKILPNGEKLWFELQWRPVAGRWIRPDQEPSADELIARSIPIAGTDVRLLAPEDNLLQVCLHTAKHSYVRAPGFRLHLDVERIVRAYPDLDWGVFVGRVQALQVKTAVYFSLLIPKELFATPIPDEVLAQLRPPAWKEKTITHMINKAGLFNPHEKKFSRGEYILFNALLYDDFRGLWRGVFPDKAWMQERYQFQRGWQAPYFHLKRIGSLLFRRLAT